MYIIIMILFIQYKSKSFIDFIPNYRQNNQIKVTINNSNNLYNQNNNQIFEKKLKDDILKNKNLEKGIKKLKDNLNKINQSEEN